MNNTAILRKLPLAVALAATGFAFSASAQTADPSKNTTKPEVVQKAEDSKPAQATKRVAKKAGHAVSNTAKKTGNVVRNTGDKMAAKLPPAKNPPSVNPDGTPKVAP